MKIRIRKKIRSKRKIKSRIAGVGVTVGAGGEPTCFQEHDL
jgi:hypothetical protein